MTEPTATEKSSLVVPDGAALGFSFNKPTALTKESFVETARHNRSASKNFATFYHMVREGLHLDRLLRLTSSRSFMEDTFARVKGDASFGNTMAKLMHGEHTHSQFSAAHLTWVSIYMNSFISVSIPENLDEIASACASLGPIAGMIEDNRELFDSLRHGLTVAEIQKGKINAHGLEVTAFAGEETVPAQLISAESSTIESNGEVLYNGLPGDRANYPSWLMPEESSLSIKIKNNNANPIMLVPTINGIPFAIDAVNLLRDGFVNSAFPISNIDPHKFYIKPGEELDLSKFHCNGFRIKRNGSGAYTSDVEYGAEIAPLAAWADQVFLDSLSDIEHDFITNPPANMVADVLQIRFESAHAFVRSFIKNNLNVAKETDIFIKRPEFADGKASSELDNPMLGTIGFCVVELSDPPVEASHTMSFDSFAMRGGGMKSFGGGAGLAHIGGGAASSAARLERSWSYSSMIHRFRGYVPINLMSARTNQS